MLDPDHADIPESLINRSPVKIGPSNNNDYKFPVRSSLSEECQLDECNQLSYNDNEVEDGAVQNTTVDLVTRDIIDTILGNQLEIRCEDEMVLDNTPDTPDDTNIGAGSFSQIMTYRAIRTGSDEIFTPDKMLGPPRSNVDIVMESPMVTPRSQRRETLGLTDCFKKINLADIDEIQTNYTAPAALNVALSHKKIAQVVREESGSVTTPSDLPRIKTISSPPPPSKMEYSPTKTEGEVPKRSLFDSPGCVQLSSDVFVPEVDMTGDLDNHCNPSKNNLDDHQPDDNSGADQIIAEQTDDEYDFSDNLGKMDNMYKIAFDNDDFSSIVSSNETAVTCGTVVGQSFTAVGVVNDVEQPNEVDDGDCNDGDRHVLENPLAQEEDTHTVMKLPTQGDLKIPSQCRSPKSNDEDDCPKLRPQKSLDQDGETEAFLKLPVQKILKIPSPCRSPKFNDGDDVPILKPIIEVSQEQNDPESVLKAPTPRNLKIPSPCRSLNNSCSFAFEDKSTRLIEPVPNKSKKLMSRHSSLKSLKSGQANDSTPKSVKFCEAPPQKLSPKPFVETQSEDEIEFLLKKIKTMKKASDDINESVTSTGDNSFALPAKLDLPNICETPTDEKHSFLDPFQFPSNPEAEQSILAAHGGDFSLSCSKDDSFQNSRRDASETALTVLQHQAILLEKDKQIAALVAELEKKQAEANDIVQNIIFVDESNAAMDVVIDECERTIAQLGEEKEKDLRSLQETKEKVAQECAQAKDDLQAVNRALNDTNRRYERNKEQICLMKDHENNQKQVVTQVQQKLRSEQSRYETLKSDANEKLAAANQKIVEVQNSKAAEILKLKTLLKKAELQVSSQEQKVEKLIKENNELTLICDELIAKC